MILTPYNDNVKEVLFRFGANVLKECRLEVAAFTGAIE
jgi:hypothetical protein